MQMFEIINTIINLIPFIDCGRVKVNTEIIYLDFFKPIVGRNHWSEENYLCEPIRYRVKCKFSVFNGKKKVCGINKCSLNLRYDKL